MICTQSDFLTLMSCRLLPREGLTSILVPRLLLWSVRCVRACVLDRETKCWFASRFQVPEPAHEFYLLYSGFGLWRRLGRWAQGSQLATLVADVAGIISSLFAFCVTTYRLLNTGMGVHSSRLRHGECSRVHPIAIHICMMLLLKEKIIFLLVVLLLT